MARVYESYASLMRLASSPDQEPEMEPCLGGKLLYVGDCGESIRPLIAAANIAGVATLALSAQQAALRQAQRDGLIDFLVNSLDEALRILKNEIRKRQAVAVAISGLIETIEAEMLERGVLPDLLPVRDALNQPKLFAIFRTQGATDIPAPETSPGENLYIWQLPPEYAQQPAAFDAILTEHLAPGDHLNRRWVRTSLRYLGTASRRFRSLACDEQTATKLIARFGAPFEASPQQ